EARPGIEEGGECWPAAEQGALLQGGERLVRRPEGVRPDQSAVSPDAPALGDFSGDDVLAACGPPEDQPFQGEQLAVLGGLDLRLAAESPRVEEDRLLWQPGKARPRARRQPGRNERRLPQGAIDLLRGLRGDGDGCPVHRRHLALEPVSPRDAARGVEENGLPHLTVQGPWKHDPHGRPVEDVLDASAAHGASDQEAAATVRPLQILVGRLLTGETPDPTIAICRADQNPVSPCGLLYGILTLVTSCSEPSGCVA